MPTSVESESTTPDAGVESSRALGLIERFFLIAGTALFAFLVWKIGAATVWANLRMVGWGFVFIIGQEVCAMTANTLGWRAAFPRRHAVPPFRALFAARVAGDGINCVTPTATIGGEFVRARMIEDPQQRTAAWAAVAVAKITQSVGQVAFILLGLLFVAVTMPLPGAMRAGLLVTVPVFASAVVAAAILLRRGLFGGAARLAERFGLSLTPRIRERLGHLDDEIRHIYSEPGPFLLSSGFFFIGWMFGVLEIYLILHFLGVGATWSRSLTIEALSVTIDGLLFFVPAKAGTQEGGKMLIFTLLGLDPAKGFTLGLARRIRELSWAGIGLLMMSRHQFRRAASNRS